MRTIVLCSCLVLASAVAALPAPAQVLVHFPAVDDATPQRFYELDVYNGYLWDGWEILWAPERRIRAMTHDYSRYTFVSLLDVGSGSYELGRTGVRFSPFEFTVIGPIGYPVEGMVLGRDVLYGVAWDESEVRSVLVTIDRQTGAGTLVTKLPSGLRFRGLTNQRYAGDLFGVTRDPLGSAIYRIDTTTWEVAHLVDLPAPCEAIGGFDYDGLLAAGERLFWTRSDGTQVTEVFLEDEYASPPECIVAMARESGFSPVESVTWGRIKRQFAGE